MKITKKRKLLNEEEYDRLSPRMRRRYRNKKGSSSSAEKSPYLKLVDVVKPYFSHDRKYTARGRGAGRSGEIAQTATFMGSPYPNSEEWYINFYKAVGKVSKGEETTGTLIDILDSEETKKIFNFKSDYMRKEAAEEKAQKISDALESLKSDLQNFANEKAPANEGKQKMKITKNTLQKLIKEEIQKVLQEEHGGGLYVLTGYSGKPMETIYSSMEEAQKWADMFNQDGLDATPKRLEVQDLQVDPQSAGVAFGLYNNSGIDLPGAPKSKSRDSVGLIGLYGSREEARQVYDKILSDFKAGLVDDDGQFSSYDDGLFHSQIADNDMSGLEIIRFKVQQPEQPAGIRESRRRRRRR